MERTAPQTSWLLFCSGPQWYGVPAESASQIVTADTLTAVPGTARHVLGVFTYRGEIVPVIDLGALRRDEDAEAQRVVVVRAAEGSFALTVTRVAGIIEATAPGNSLGTQGLQAHLRGPISANGQQVVLIDVEGMFGFLADVGAQS